MATIVGSRPGAAQQDPAPASHQFTCNTCQVAFRFAETQKGHMKSDWHRYNLKRRVASLPPISSEVFSEKVLQARAATTAEADRAGFQQACDVCQRTYYSENSFRNHLSSQKHKAKEAAAGRAGGAVPDDASSVMSSTFSLGEPIPVAGSEIDSDVENDFSEVVDGLEKASLKERSSSVKQPAHPDPAAKGQDGADTKMSGEANEAAKTPALAPKLESCLFCNYESPSVALNVLHMERIHSMFIPEKQYLVDLEGLLTFLNKRVHEYLECLYCFKLKSTPLAVQTHMRDTGHCKIPFTTEDEQLDIGDYYDFRSTYSDGEDDSDDESVDEDKQIGGAKLGAKRTAKAVGEDGDEIMGEDAGWETDSSASSCASEDLKAIPVDNTLRQFEKLEKHPHHSSHDPRHHHQKDGWHSHAHKHNRAVFHDDTELHLPSGKSVGHRSLQKYWRQNLHNHPSPEERAERLAIEAAGPVEPMSVDGDNQIAARRERLRKGVVVQSRADGGTGMIGVAEQKKKEVVRTELRSQKAEQRAQRQEEWKLNKQNNHQKYYNYQIL